MDLARAILAQSNGGADKVCRNLFGPVNHMQLREDYEKALNNTIEEARQKWNFDFVTEVPLEGDYKWERVAYTIADMEITDGLQDEKENACTLCGKMSCHDQCQESEGSELDDSKRKQALITDYFQVKRRCTTGSSPKSFCS